MTLRSKLGALLGAGLLSFALFGVALAATGPSDDGVTPTLHSGNITVDGNGGSDQAACDAADAVEIDAAGSGTTDNGVTVTLTYDSTTKAVGFSATGGLVLIAYIKGGDAYNEYDYTDPGVASDGNLFAPDNASGGPAGLSHAVFCTAAAETPTPTPGGGGGGESDQPTQPPTDTAFGTSGPSGPSDGAWLLVVALGVLLASVVVLTPARAKSRR